MNTEQTVLVVDDDAVTRMMVRRVLQEAGYEVVEAENGQQAVEICTAQPPAMVLLDVRMPVMNGFDACRSLRRLPRCANVPVVMLTALDDVLAVTLAFEAGATDFITKPINWVLLGHRARYVLRVSNQERLLRESQLTMARAQRIAKLSSWSLDLTTGECACAPELRDLLGLRAGVGATLDEILSHTLEEDRARLLDFIARIRATHAEQQTETRMRVGADVRHVLWSGNVLLGEGGGSNTAFGVIQDITERRDAEARLSYQAHFDLRTGLPNRVLFCDRMTTAIDAASRGGGRFAVLQLRTDALGKISAAASSAVADHVLKALADRIAGVLRSCDTLCRLEDEGFAALLPDVESETEAGQIVTRLLEAFAGPMSVGDWEVISAIDVGIALFPGDGGDVDTLLQRAGAALARVREQGQPESSYQFYAAGIQQRVAHQIATQVALYRGLERDEFELHYQPQLDLHTQRIACVETLLRWRRPGHGLQMPDQFIHILEASGLIHDAGDWVLRRAAQAVRALDVRLAINVSPRQFRSANLASRLSRIVEETGLAPQRVEVEITEQAVLADEAHGMAVLAALSERGMRITLDDYGIGFSSLQRLKQMPLDTLKIDKFFVTSLLTSSVDAAIVRSTIDLCHELGVSVVAEGVEDLATAQRLREFGCDQAQGYGIARPMPIDDLHRWLRERGAAGA